MCHYLLHLAPRPTLIQVSGALWHGETHRHCLIRPARDSTQGTSRPTYPESYDANLTKFIYAGNFPYLVIISMTKTSILLFYLRLFGTPGTRPGFRKLLYVTQALVVIWFIGSLIPGIFRCHPVADFWDPLVVGAPDVRHYCTNTNTYYLASSAFNVALDFWILVLPLSIVWTLQLRGRRKLGLSAIFLLGGLYVPCAPVTADVSKCLRSLVPQHLRREYRTGVHDLAYQSLRFLL